MALTRPVTDARGRPIGPGHVPIPVIIPPYRGGSKAVGVQNQIVTSVEEQSLVVAGQNNPLRILYGRQVVGADICGIGDHEGNLILLCVWCEGEVDAIETFWVNGQVPNSQITGLATHYTGTATQGVDSRLRLAFSSGSYTFTDAMPGIAYSVFEVRPGLNAGFPQFTALIRGLKVASTFGGGKSYSTNPAYCLADFIENTRYGMGRSVDWASVATVAAYAGASIGSPSEVRHQFSLVIDSPQAVDQWLNVMRDYADCWVVPEGEGYRLILDSTGTVGNTKTITGISKANPARVTASAHGFAANAVIKVNGITTGMVEANGKVGVLRVVDANNFDLAGVDSLAFTTWTAGGSATQIGASSFSFGTSHIMARSFSGGLRGVMDSPTVVEVEYTDTSTYPWRTDKTDPVFIPGVYDNPPTVPFRRTTVAKSGLTRYSEANRYAIELLNSGQVDDLSVKFQAFDVALSLQAGDLIDVTHDGLDSKLMRLTAIEAVEPGRWNIAATEHDDAKYSTTVVSGPSTIDTTLPSPLSPPTVTGLVVTEVVTQIATGDFVSQISATWTDLAPPTGAYPFVLHYRIDIYDGALLAETGTVQRTSGPPAAAPHYLSAALPENRLYTVRVYTISSLSVASAPAELSITNNGKTALPSDVPSISAYEVGGTVFISWEPASDLDLAGYWLRFGTTSDTWSTAATLQRLTGVRFETKILPAGTNRIFIKALDSIRNSSHPYGQESASATYVDVVVTLDTNAFVAVDVTYSAPTVLTNFVEVPGGWVTSAGETWDDLFTGAAMSTFTDPIWSYHASVTSILVSEAIDHGTQITASWFSTINAIDLDPLASGTFAADLELKNTVVYITSPGYAKARYSRINVSTTDARTAFVPTIIARTIASVVTRSDGGFFTSSSSAGVPVTFAQPFVKLVSLQVTASGQTSNRGSYDNVTETGFDGYVIDVAGVKVAGVEASWFVTGT
jgi:hypothetical protein